jgi:ABC-2 type transport system ATP-binding protein
MSAAPAPATPTATPAIAVRGVVRRYGEFQALAGIDLDIPRGALCGLIGPNGAGKTTLLSILATLDEEFDGDVFIDGVDVKRDPAGARRRIGFVPDHTAIYDALTVQEYLAFFAAAAGLPRDRRGPAVDEVIGICALDGLRDRPAGGLSKGLTQRLCVARALLHRPRILLLDEPASGLDPRARIELKELLKRLARDGVTVLISSHILTELGDFCDHVVVLESGRVKAADRVDQLFAKVAGQQAGLTPRRRLLLEVIGDPARARDIAVTQPSVFDVQHDGQVLAITMATGARETARLVRVLIEGGVDVASVVPERQNLEALFLTITTSKGGAA